MSEWFNERINKLKIRTSAGKRHSRFECSKENKIVVKPRSLELARKSLGCT